MLIATLIIRVLCGCCRAGALISLWALIFPAPVVAECPQAAPCPIRCTRVIGVIWSVLDTSTVVYICIAQGGAVAGIEDHAGACVDPVKAACRLT